MADLSNVNSPADLVKYNQSVKPVDAVQEVLKDVYELSASEGKAIIQDILETMIHWHKSTADDLLESDPQKSAIWVQDLTRLNTAFDLINEVEV